jgi:hypothetical protein
MCADVCQLGKADRFALRQTCWTMRDILVPEIFRKVDIDLNKPGLARLQILALADPDNISRIAAALHTTELTLKLCNLSPERENSEPTHTPYRKKDENDKKRRKSAGYISHIQPCLSGAVSALKRCETLT